MKRALKIAPPAKLPLPRLAILLVAIAGVGLAGCDNGGDPKTEIGADHAIDYSAHDFVAEVKRGAVAEIPIWKVMTRRLTLTGSTLRARDIGFKTGLRDTLVRTVWPLLADGRLRPVIDSTFPLADASAAHTRLESGMHVGKIVLTL